MASYYKKTGLMEYGILAVAVLLVLNWLGIDLLKPKRKNESYDDVITKYPVNLANVSYDKDAFERLCVRLVRAMDTNTLWEGTDNAEVNTVFGYMHTLDDVHQLYNIFGVRTYGGSEWGQWQIESDPKYSLQTWLNEELSETEQKAINKIFEDKNINFEI